MTKHQRQDHTINKTSKVRDRIYIPESFKVLYVNHRLCVIFSSWVEGVRLRIKVSNLLTTMPGQLALRAKNSREYSMSRRICSLRTHTQLNCPTSYGSCSRDSHRVGQLHHSAQMTSKSIPKIVTLQDFGAKGHANEPRIVRLHVLSSAVSFLGSPRSARLSSESTQWAPMDSKV